MDILILLCILSGLVITTKGWIMGQKSEAYDSLIWFFGGLALIVLSLIVMFIRWLF